MQSEEFSVGQLFASLGLNSNPRFVCAADGHVTVRADKLLLETILPTRRRTRLHHGAAGGRVHANAQVIAAVPASDHPPTLRISLRNEAGSNHAALLALSETTPNLLHASTDELVGANTMTAASLGSTFLGLRDINQVATTAFSPPAQASLTADATSVTFELAVEVAIVQETPPPPPPAASGAGGAGSRCRRWRGAAGRRARRGRRRRRGCQRG